MESLNIKEIMLLTDQHIIRTFEIAMVSKITHKKFSSSENSFDANKCMKHFLSRVFFFCWIVSSEKKKNWSRIWVLWV